jgi:UDP-GlcNAc:undecaprenyl-phosphate GlcNAc-1-phosphate transferase
MGDTGSNFLGYALGLIVIVGAEHLTSAARYQPDAALVLVALIGYPLLDIAFVVTRRLSAGHPPFEADRRHFHYALIDGGLSHERSVQVVVSLQALLVIGMVSTVESLGFASLFA